MEDSKLSFNTVVYVWKCEQEPLKVSVFFCVVDKSQFKMATQTRTFSLKLKPMFIPGKALGMGSHMGFHALEDESHQTLQKIQK